jgi:amino acid adenylation domain-containing protein
MYAAILGVWMSGKAFIPLNHKFPHERLLKIASESDLMAVMCESKSTDQLQFLNDQWPILNYPKESVSNEIQLEEITESQQAYTLFTSGSTGVPKGIPIQHGHLRALMEDLIHRYPLGEMDKVLQSFELSFDVSIACILIAWTQGANLVVADLNGITAINAFKAIHEHQVNFVTLPPSALYYLRRLRMLSMPLPWVTKTLFTGEALSFNVAQEWKSCATQTTIDNAYGPTEGTVWSLIYELDDHTTHETVNGLCPIGKPLMSFEMMIVNESLIPVKNGERGELWLGGPQIFHGYVHQPDKTREVLFQDETETYWYKTGDIVVRNEWGNVVYVNRKDNQVQVNGFRVELGEVEHHLRTIIGSEAAVVLAHEKEGVIELVGFIQGDWNQEDILSQMREKVPGYMVPRQLFIIEALPINTSGKIDKKLLREKYL